ncbi:hypothetical protein GS592_25150 [Rhodococcus hoagii]|nr:hypothetical protein [Prescottella equi]
MSATPEGINATPTPAATRGQGHRRDALHGVAFGGRGAAVGDHRHAGHPAGTAESGRNDPLLDELVGMFVGTVALRAHVHGDATFPDLVDAVRASDIDAFVHATTPFDVVQERCGEYGCRRCSRTRASPIRPSCGRGWKCEGGPCPERTPGRISRSRCARRQPASRSGSCTTRPSWTGEPCRAGRACSGPSSTAWPWTRIGASRTW